MPPASVRAHAARRLIRFLLFALPWIALFCWSAPAEAYPFMIRHGFAKCASCHTDPMGGETLTGFGRVTSDTRLSTRWDGGTAPTNAAELLYGIDEPEWLRLGGSFRFMSIYELPDDDQDFETSFFPMQVDAYGQARFGAVRIGGSLGLARVEPGSPHARPAQITSANQGKDFNLISRTHWIGVDLNESTLLRAGRINLPFGIRMPEHVIWARDATRTDRESDQQHGVALSYSKGASRGEIMAIAGNYQIGPDEFRERGYSLYGEHLFSPGFALGLSSLITRAENDRIVFSGTPYTRQAHGLTMRWTPFQDLVLLAEADALLATDTSFGYVGMLQADLELFQGFHAMATFEALDKGARDGEDSIKGAGEAQLGSWLSINWFVYTHMDFRIDLLTRQESPVTILGQFHFYF